MELTANEINIYLTLDFKYHQAFKKLQPGWVFEQPIGVFAPFSEQQEAIRRPGNWKLFSSYDETFPDYAKVLTRRNYWLPDDYNLIALYAGREIKAKLEPDSELKIDWNRNLEDGNHILVISCGDSEFRESCPTEREAALKVLQRASKIIHSIRVPSIIQLQGSVEIIQKGWNGEPSIVGTFQDLERFKDKHLAYWTDTGHGSFSKCLGRMHLLEGDFYLLQSPDDKSSRSYRPTRKIKPIRKVKI